MVDNYGIYQRKQRLMSGFMIDELDKKVSTKVYTG